jgi:predicted nucleic acid-binding protein
VIVSVDTNIILDVVTDDPVHASSSGRLLAQTLDTGSLVICDIVYAELAAQYDSRESLDLALAGLGIRVVESGRDAAWLAGTKWSEYRLRGGSRKRVLADFLIGAHALVYAECLLTRDRGFYRTYFAELKQVDGSEGA